MLELTSSTNAIEFSLVSRNIGITEPKTADNKFDFYSGVYFECVLQSTAVRSVLIR